MQWTPILGACVVAVATFHFTRPKNEVLLADMIRAVRVATVALVLGLPFALDDPSEETLASSPTRLWVRRSLRIAIATPVILGTWLLIVRSGAWAFDHRSVVSVRSFGGAVDLPGGRFPMSSLSLEFAAVAIGSLALSALGAKQFGDGRGGVAAGPALLALLGASLALPHNFTMFASDARDAIWSHAQNRWAMALGMALVILWHLSRDPGRTRIAGRIRRARRLRLTE